MHNIFRLLTIFYSILGDVFHNGFHQLMLHCEGNEKSLVQCPSKNVKSYVFKNKCHQSSQVFIYCSERRDNDAIISLNKVFLNVFIICILKSLFI